jgi:CheY-like chemotaxis protein
MATAAPAKIDGIAACRALKSDVDLPFIPIILVAAKADHALLPVHDRRPHDANLSVGSAILTWRARVLL